MNPKRLRPGHGRLYRRFLFSLLMLSLLLLIFFVSAYTTVEHVMKREIIDANSTALRQLSGVMDSHLSEAYALLGWIDSEKTVLLSATEDMQDGFISGYKRYELYKLLKTRLHEAFADAFLYFHHSGLLVSQQSGSTDFALYQQQQLRHDPRTFDDWLTLFHGRLFYQIVPMRSPTQGERTLALMTSLPSAYYKKANVTACVIFHPAHLESLFQSAQAQDGIVFMLGQDCGILYASSDRAFDFEALEAEPLANESVLRTSQGQYVLLTRPSAYGVQYVSAIPVAIFWQNLNTLRVAMALFATVFLAAAILLSVLFTRRQYQPISSLLQSVSSNTSLAYDRTQWNEIEYIDLALKSAVAEKRSLEERLESSDMLLLNRLFWEYLSGSAHPDEGAVRRLQSDMPFVPTRFRVAIFLVETGAVTVGDFQGVLANASDGMHVHVVRADGSELICIISLREDADAAQGLRALKCAIEQASGSLCTVAASDAAADFSTIAEAYRQARATMTQRVISGAGSLLLPQPELEASFLYQAGFHQRAEEIVTSALTGKQGDPHTAVRKARALFFEAGIATLVSVRCYMYDMTLLIVNTLQKKCGAAFCKDHAVLEKLMHADTLESFQFSASLLLEEARSFYENEVVHNEFSRRILSFIEQNYMDTSLGVGTMAQHFGISSAHLTQRFRQETGYTPSEAITSVRMRHACALLSDTSRTVEEIAQAVGIIGSSALIRTFKRQFSVTPGTYRRNAQSHEPTDGAI